MYKENIFIKGLLRIKLLCFEYNLIYTLYKKIITSQERIMDEMALDVIILCLLSPFCLFNITNVFSKYWEFLYSVYRKQNFIDWLNMWYNWEILISKKMLTLLHQIPYSVLQPNCLWENNFVFKAILEPEKTGLHLCMCNESCLLSFATLQTVMGKQIKDTSLNPADWALGSYFRA